MNRDSELLASRRAIVAALGALPLTVAGVTSTEAVAADALRADDVTVRYQRMRCGIGGNWALWVYAGELIGMPTGQVARRLVRVAGFSFSRMLATAAGEYAARLEEAGYYCDLVTGRPLDQWTNPFSGREVRAAHYRSGQDFHCSGTQLLPSRPLPPGVDFRGVIGNLAEVQDLDAVSEDLYVRMPAEPAAGDKPARPERFATSLSTLTARPQDLARPSSAWVDSSMTFSTMNSFAAWLGMGDIPGIQNMRLVGRKFAANQLSAIPSWLLDRVRLEHPDLLTVPST